MLLRQWNIDHTDWDSSRVYSVSGSSNFDQKERNLLPSSLAQVFVIINILFKGLQKSILTKKKKKNPLKKGEKESCDLWCVVVDLSRYFFCRVLQLIWSLCGLCKWRSEMKSLNQILWSTDARENEVETRGCAKEKAREDILCMAEIKDRSLVRALNITAGTGEHGTASF